MNFISLGEEYASGSFIQNYLYLCPIKGVPKSENSSEPSPEWLFETLVSPTLCLHPFPTTTILFVKPNLNFPALFTEDSPKTTPLDFLTLLWQFQRYSPKVYHMYTWLNVCIYTYSVHIYIHTYISKKVDLKNTST